jgi:hypothetical protein
MSGSHGGLSSAEPGTSRRDAASLEIVRAPRRHAPAVFGHAAGRTAHR